MKVMILLLLGLVTVGAGCAATPSDTSAGTPHIGRVRHVVVFRFKDGATDEQVRRVEQAFGALPEKIDVIRDYEWGTNVSPEGLDEGFTHCFLVTFDSEADRDAYLRHPAHQAFVKELKPVLDKAFVIDYVARR